MKKRLIKIFKAPWYFATFAVYPGLALLANNIAEVRYTAGIRPIAVILCGAAIFFLILRLIYRSWHRAAFGVTALTILFFSYGHLYDLLSRKIEIPNLVYIMLGVWFALSILILVWAGLPKARFKKAAPILNIISFGLAMMLVTQVGWWSRPHGENGVTDEYAPVQDVQVTPGQLLPDIYYIIPDSYGRSDLLHYAFEIDNSGFIYSLEKLGFYIANCSQSNYNRTDISLASSLNLDYLQNLDGSYIPGNLNRSTLWNSINRSTVRTELENAGYKTIAFASGFAWSEMTNADVYLAPSPAWSGISGFETMLIRTTPARHFEDLGWFNLDQIDGQRYRERTQLVFNSMDELAHMPGPKFVFIHIISPHPPFVYGADGLPTDPAAFLDQNRLYNSNAYTRGYRNQVSYIDGKLETALSMLIRESEIPPVIILQGDHGPWLQNDSNMFKILNAYYLPGHNDLLYPSISPVNTFRLVFNAYLGTEYDLLPDTSYYSPVPDIFNLTKISNPCLGN